MLYEAARGRFPPNDGLVQVFHQPPGRTDAVVAFTVHHVIAVGLDPQTILSHLPPDSLPDRLLCVVGAYLLDRSMHFHKVRTIR